MSATRASVSSTLGIEGNMPDFMGSGARIAVRGLLLVATASHPGASPAPEEDAKTTVVDALVAEAKRLSDFVRSPLAHDFLRAAARLEPAPARVVYRHKENRRRFETEKAFSALAPDLRAQFERVELEPSTYYMTRYGSPLAYCRALDLVGGYGPKAFAGLRVLDYGYGTIGHLRLMALNGADVVGVDVDPYLTALYSEPEDQGAVPGPAGRAGSVRLVDGFWPGAVADEVGSGFDLFLSKNTLKRGYVHPEREADPARLLNLGVSDETYVRAMFRALKPGGVAVIYNLSPKQNPPDQPYIPWADGRFPFDRDLVEGVGFEVLAFDVVDDEPARRMARILGWDAAGMDVDDDLFAHYTVLRRPR